MYKTKSGFTIVELLIVIVVIGILAAITIVAYNGIQARSTNAAIVSMVNAYKKGIQLYAADKGAYPTDFPACLANQASLGSGSNQCTTESATHNIKTGFNNAVAPYMSSVPTQTAKVISGTVGSTTHQFLNTGQYNTWNGIPSIYYYLLGTNVCPSDSFVGTYANMGSNVLCVHQFPTL